jgi:hypothetical protein
MVHGLLEELVYRPTGSAVKSNPTVPLFWGFVGSLFGSFYDSESKHFDHTVHKTFDRFRDLLRRLTAHDALSLIRGEDPRRINIETPARARFGFT